MRSRAPLALRLALSLNRQSIAPSCLVARTRPCGPASADRLLSSPSPSSLRSITTAPSSTPNMAQNLSTPPTYEAVVLTRYPPAPTILHLELNEPKTYNSLSQAMFRDWTAALQWAAKEPSVHAVVVSGRPNGKSGPKSVFCAGMNMSPDVQERAFSDEGITISDARKTSNAARDFIDVCIDFPKLLVAAVNGHAFGMAVTMLPLHDLVYTIPGTTFKTPFAELGLCAEGCSSVTFPPILGPGLTSRMLYFSEVIPAEELLPSGFLTSIVPSCDPTSLPSWVLSHITERLGASPTGGDAANVSLLSIQRSKELVRPKDEKARLKRVNAAELEQVAQIIASNEFKVGLNRFVQRQLAKRQAKTKSNL